MTHSTIPNVREAHSDDVTSVIALWKACGLTRPWNDPVQDFEFSLNGPSSTVLVAEKNTKLIAATLVGYDGHRGSVYYFGVHPDYQKHGLGQTLLTAAEDWLTAQGVWKLNLLVRRDNADAVKFYEAIGYEDQDCVALGKRLDGKTDRSALSSKSG